MKSLYFIRHGQSLANTGAKSMPDKDIPLTDLGEKQANLLLSDWQTLNITPSCIYSSPLLRAKQTAIIFNQNYALNIHILPELKEFCCLSFDNIKDMMGNERAVLAKHYWQNATIEFKDGDDADSFCEFDGRVSAFLNRLEYFEHNSVFFGHGIWVGLLAWRLLGLSVKTNADMQKFRQFQTALPMYNTVIYRLDMIENIAQMQVVQRNFN